MDDHLSRRDFLFYGGATLAGVTLGQLGRRQLARADERAAAWRASAPERWAVSVCRECPAACGVRVRLVDGIPVKLEGNPLCPIGRGRLCAKGQAALEAYFDPDRLTGPARRVGERGSNRWEPIPWDAAISLLASKLRSAGARDGWALAIGVEERGPIAEAWESFWRGAGGRTARISAAPTAADLRSGLAALTGVAADPLFDLEHATYLLSFGAPVVEDYLSPIWAQRSYGRFRRGGSQARGRLVQVEGRRSLTARKADEWIVVPTERQAALAYGLISVLLRENRIDHAFLNQHAGNLAAFERAVVTRYSPDGVAAASGVPVVTILRLARDLVATARPLVVVAADADPALVDAVFALDALVGALDRAGGVHACPPHAFASAAATDAAPTTADAPRLVALRDPALFRSLSAPPALASAVERAEFVVSFSPYLDEAASAADLLMPIHTPLERWHAVAPSSAYPGEALAVARPAVAARLDTRELIEVLSAVGRAAGRALPSDTESAGAVVGTALSRLAATRRGGPYSTTYETEWLLQLERGGWWTSPVSSPEEFPGAVLEAGGWVDPFFESGAIVQSLRRRGGLTFQAPAADASAPVTAAQGAREAFPLRLVAFTPALVNVAGGANQPALFELLGQPESLPWRLWAELAPEAARASGIEAGASIRITSAHGAIEAMAVLVDSMPPGSVALAFVPAVPGGRWARRIAEDIKRLWPQGRPGREPVAVRVSRA